MEKRVLQLRRYRFSRRDIERLAGHFLAQTQQSSDKPDSYRLSLRITFDDGLTIDRDDASHLEDDAEINDHSLEELRFRFYESGSRRDVNLSLYKAPYYVSELEVAGEDAEWVRNTEKLFEETLKLVMPSDSWLYRRRHALAWCVVILIAGAFFWILAQLTFQILDRTVDPYGLSYMVPGLGIGVSGILGAYLYDFTIRSIEEAYPAIEFDTGPCHRRTAKRARHRLRGFAIQVCIPILIAIGLHIMFKFVG